MRPDELVDIRVQDRLRRDLAIKLGQAVIDAIDAGLLPGNASKAVKEIFESELRSEETRRVFARSHL
jgi:hypothetical protein